MAALTEVDWLLVGGAAVAAGAVNALAGGGTLISFPLLTAAGIPPVIANVTNTVALCPGYLAAALAQSRDLAGQGDVWRSTFPSEHWVDWRVVIYCYTPPNRPSAP